MLSTNLAGPLLLAMVESINPSVCEQCPGWAAPECRNAIVAGACLYWETVLVSVTSQIIRRREDHSQQLPDSPRPQRPQGLAMGPTGHRQQDDTPVDSRYL